MTEQMKAATIRALYGGILSAVLVFLVSLQVETRTRDTFEDAAIAAGVALFSYMLTRGMAEGLIDSTRQPTKADVGQ